MIRAKEIKKKLELRLKRKRKIRGKIFGVSTVPRISIFRSNKCVYAQAIDDSNSVTICSSDSKSIGKANKEASAKVGAELADKLKKANITTGIFDRNGYKYHGVVASFADALRSNGIKI